MPNHFGLGQTIRMFFLFFLISSGSSGHLLVNTATSSCTSRTKSCWREGSDYICNNNIPKVLKGSGSFTIQCIFEDIMIDNDTFSDESYHNLKSLSVFSKDNAKITFGTNCFTSLYELTELHMSISRTSIDSGWLSGLSNLTVFNCSSCFDMLPEKIYEIYDHNSMPKLNVFALHRFGLQHRQFELNERFWNFIGERPVKSINLDYVQISKFDLTAFYKVLTKLKVLSMRFSTIGNFQNIPLASIKNEVGKVEKLDFTGVLLPSSARPFCFIAIANVHNIIQSFDLLSFFRRTKTFIANDICNAGNPMSVINYKNITITSNYEWTLETFEFEGNNIQILDLKQFYVRAFMNLKVLSLSRNNLNFIHPDVFETLSSLQYIDLSYNNLFAMNSKNETLFKGLLSNLVNIQTLNMSSNSIAILPKYFLIHNTKLRYLDLSNNYLRTFNLHLKPAAGLNFLNLSGNHMETLTLETMKIFDECIGNNDNLITWLDVSNNMFQCNMCNHLTTIQWLNDFSRIEGSLLTCADKGSVYIEINDNVVSELKAMCKRTLRLGLAIGFAVGVPLLAIVTLISTIIIRRKRKRQQKKEEAIALLKAENDEYKFVVFLSFNSVDEQFLSEHVITPLDEHLRDAIGIDRTTICIGDREFMPGRPIIDEIVHSLRKSAIVLILLSDAYAQSMYCRQEFEQALRMDKEVILLIKDKIHEEYLTPAMQELYKKNVRILWTLENDKYELKTTWNHVCASIIDVFSRKHWL